jgi:uncharacterized protein with PIN domain
MTAGEEAGARRFVADAALGRLARYLRMLGYDAAYIRDADGLAALREALREGRTLLTRRRDLAARTDVDVFLIGDDDVRWQLAAVAARFGLAFGPAVMTRCLECNVPLTDVSPAEVWDFLPPHVRKTQDQFQRCPGCGRVYWPGTHYARAVARLLAVVRAVPYPTAG